MGKKDDGMGNKTGYKKRKAKGKQRARKKDRTKKTRQAGQPAFSYKNNACFMRKQDMRPVHLQAGSGSHHSYK